jgi:CRISPR/Cas system-associated exonuclease Cas4 (RecB family)
MACDDMPLVGTRVSIQELYTRYIKEYLFCSMKLYLGSRGGNKSQLGGHKRVEMITQSTAPTLNVYT